MREEGNLAATDSDPQQEKGQLEGKLKEMAAMVRDIAEQCHRDSQCLLSLLRTLESLHREIRTEKFEPSLPNTRNALYQLLKDIDETGGWPYIERMRLQTLLRCFSPEEVDSTES